MIVTGAIVLLLWIPLRQRPGIGTILYAVSIGPIIQRRLPLFTIREPGDGTGPKREPDTATC